MRIIYAVAGEGPSGVGVSALARELQIPKAVVHRLLKGLAADGFLAFDESDKKYRLGSGALLVGLAASRQIDIHRIVRPLLERLVRATAETATLSLKRGWTRVYVDQVLSPQEIRMEVTTGVAYPLYAGASSKAILAAMTDAAIHECLASEPRHAMPVSTMVTDEELLAEVEVIRERGYAVSSGERDPAASSVAAAVLDSSGRPMGSLSLCGPRGRFEQADIDRYGRLVREAATEASAALGYRAS